MRLALYVHDFRLEVGHSNSLIELIRHLPHEVLLNIDEIEVVSCRATSLDTLFPNYQGKLTWTKIPLEIIKPSILKSVFFQLWVFIYNKFFQKKNTYRIGIGICAMDVDATSIQFIHHQWTKKGLEIESHYPVRKLYKKLLFKYFEKCEEILFNRKGLKLFAPAKFLTKFVSARYPNSDSVTIYSGVNLTRFEISSISKQELKSRLLQKHSALAKLNIEEPIFLFVGAYERKGLSTALELLKNVPNAQFIVIGNPSYRRVTNWLGNTNVFSINFSNEISDFYSLADAFIFPTIYEPFGLVLFEAMAMGLAIITNKSEVGASEQIAGLPEVYFSDDDNFVFPDVKIKSHIDRVNLRNERINKLGDISWEQAGRELAKFLFYK